MRQGLAERDPSKPFVIMYHGSLVERHGLDLAVAALNKVRDTVPRVELRVYGRSTPFLEKVMESVRQSQISDLVRYLGPRNLDEIAGQIDRLPGATIERFPVGLKEIFLEHVRSDENALV